VVLRVEKVPWAAEAAVVDPEELRLGSSFDSACGDLASSCFAGLVCSGGAGIEAGAETGFVQGVAEVVEVIEAFVVTAVVDVVGGADVAEIDAAVAAGVVETCSGTE
jgi:hypothetical protein